MATSGSGGSGGSGGSATVGLAPDTCWTQGRPLPDQRVGELRDSLDAVTGRLSHFSEGRLTADRGPVPPPDANRSEQGRPPGG